MYIYEFERELCDVGKSMKVKLPEEGLKLDPRVNHPHEILFSIDYHDDGITATLTRIDNDWDDRVDSFSMRVFDPEIEEVPDFNTTIYVYFGLDDEFAHDERAPSDTSLIIIHPSVKIIQEYAFRDCRKLKRVIMHENVEVIETCAFWNCRSLDAVFLPSSIKKIGDWAFYLCTNLRILSIPQTIDIDQIGQGIIHDCHAFFRIAQIPHYHDNDQVNQYVMDFNGNLPPLHKECLHTNVTTQSIRQCIDTHGTAAAYNTNYGRDSMTPMHILALNTHADNDAILSLFHANMGAVFEPYSEGDGFISSKTPLECLCEYDVDCYLSIIAALCRHREAHSSPTVVEEPIRNKRQKLN